MFPSRTTPRLICADSRRPARAAQKYVHFESLMRDRAAAVAAPRVSRDVQKENYRSQESISRAAAPLVRSTIAEVAPTVRRKPHLQNPADPAIYEICVSQEQSPRCKTLVALADAQPLAAAAPAPLPALTACRIPLHNKRFPPRQRSFNWQSTAFVMRGLSVRLRPLALLGRPRTVIRLSPSRQLTVSMRL